MKYYLSKLKDRTCTGKYGDGGTWYTAAEELGVLGEAAIPGLIRKLDSIDPYELNLTLYALLLASQADSVKQKTNGEYVNLEVVLSEEHNGENKKIALDWWKKYGSNIQR